MAEFLGKHRPKTTRVGHRVIPKGLSAEEGRCDSDHQGDWWVG